MGRFPVLVLTLFLMLLASCGGEPPREEYVQDPRATAAETPDVTEPLGRPAGDPATAVEAFLLALRLGQDDKLVGMLYPPGGDVTGTPLGAKLAEVEGSTITDWGEISVGPERPGAGDVLEEREVSVRVHRGESSQVWRVTVARTNAGWYIGGLED
jgi:hypothetical protein